MVEDAHGGMDIWDGAEWYEMVHGVSMSIGRFSVFTSTKELLCYLALSVSSFPSSASLAG